MHALFIEGHNAFVRYLVVPGQGVPVVWLHGMLCSSTAELLPGAVARPLAGRESFVVDLLGYGYSDRPAEFSYSLTAHAATIVSLVEWIARPVHLVGHSLGGTSRSWSRPSGPRLSQAS